MAKEVWTLLLQSVLIGKAREIYSALPVEKNAQYEEVRQAILEAYELVPKHTTKSLEIARNKSLRLMSSLPKRRRHFSIAGVLLSR